MRVVDLVRKHAALIAAELSLCSLIEAVGTVIAGAVTEAPFLSKSQAIQRPTVGAFREEIESHHERKFRRLQLPVLASFTD